MVIKRGFEISARSTSVKLASVEHPFGAFYETVEVWIGAGGQLIIEQGNPPTEKGGWSRIYVAPEDVKTFADGVMTLAGVSAYENLPKGCVCPAGAEKTCQRFDCGRRTVTAR